ncbi:MAG: DUF2505 family protein [Deltaproteobacteria bacterium]|nr:DUF2505 family protein [Deltaproteobacteria bacterium]
MYFTVSHDFDAPLDAVEQAALSPELPELLVAGVRGLGSVHALESRAEDGELRRVLRFQASASLPLLGRRRTSPDRPSWEQHLGYRLLDHQANWSIVPAGERDEHAAWRRYFRSEGTYRLDPIPGGRTRRSVAGRIEVRLPVLGPALERFAVSKVRRIYDAEAEALCRLCERAS